MRDANSKKKTGFTVCKSIQKKGKADLGTKWLLVKERKSKNVEC